MNVTLLDRHGSVFTRIQKRKAIALVDAGYAVPVFRGKGVRKGFFRLVCTPAKALGVDDAPPERVHSIRTDASIFVKKERVRTKGGQAFPNWTPIAPKNL